MSVHHKRLNCGHRFVPGQLPRFRNCELCWFAFFQTHGEVTKTCTEVFHDHGFDTLLQLTNKKFAKNFVTFMAALAHWQKTASAGNTETNLDNEQSISGTSSSSGDTTGHILQN